jgi:hypothetical protein
MAKLTKCACVSTDAYRCWAVRYGKSAWDRAEIDMDGGPCECACHEDDEEDGPWFQTVDAGRAALQERT